jgi:phage I-like protein
MHRRTLPSTCTQLRITALSGSAVAANLPATGAIPLPEKLLIVPWGTTADLSGNPVICDDYTISVLAANQTAHGFEEIALDFAHSTVGEPDAKEGKPQFVAGYGKLSAVAGEGIYYIPTIWTPEGEASYTGRHYRDLSPTIARDEQGRVTFVHSVALCRQGQIPNLHAYSAPAQPTIPTKQNMNYKALICKMLGLPEDATDEQITAAATAAAVEEKSASATEEKPAPAVDPMAANNVIIARLDQIERNAIIDRAAAAGKVIPLSAEEVNAMAPNTLRSMVEKLPSNVVPLSATVPAPGTGVPAVKALSAEEKLICQQLNITEEQYLKTL